MNQLKKLAGQTAIYGVSSILGRILNYFLVGLHTHIFITSEMGVVSVLYGYTALILIIITFGMETTYFRFATKGDAKNSYNIASTAVTIASTMMMALLFLNADNIISILPVNVDVAQGVTMIKWLAAIIFIDGVTAIPFAKLRIENRPTKFVTAKLVAIFANITLQLFFLVVCPAIYNQEFLPGLYNVVHRFYNPDLGIEYIFLANLLSNALIFLMLFKEFLAIRFKLTWSILKPMLAYSMPLLLTGIAGWFTTELDKVVIADWVSTDGLSIQGVYSQTFKLGAIMVLAIQAFRYAAEPFFFSQSKDADAPELFAKTLHYFTLLALLILLAISVNVGWLADLLLRNPDYRVALYLVPIIMFGKLLYGVYINLSIWFKLQDKTAYGLLFTLLGAAVALTGNYMLLPRIGYLGSAITIVLSFGTMSVACYLIGRKHLKIPYNFMPLLVYTVIIGGIVYASFLITFANPFIDIAFNLVLPIVVAAIIYFIEKKKIYAKIN